MPSIDPMQSSSFNMLVPSDAAQRRHAILGEVADALRTANSAITNIEAVIATTKFSSQHVADAFGGTRGLFIALVERIAGAMLEPLADDAAGTSFQQKLLAFAHRVVHEYSAPQVQSLYRIALTEVIRNTGIGFDFYKHGPGLVTAGLARFFEAAQAAGIVLEVDSRQLASHFMALLRADLEVPDASSGPLRVRGDMTRIVELFCAGIQSEVEDARAAV
jgi:AcrR family transcriptional regulator